MIFDSQILKFLIINIKLETIIGLFDKRDKSTYKRLRKPYP